MQAFGLIFPLEYANKSSLENLVEVIQHNSTGLYKSDIDCPLNWEPSGYDFLSPCLQEAALMGEVLSDSTAYGTWLRSFLPSLFSEDFELVPGEVLDRTDGKLVHLDGLNFSRAWSLYSITLKLGDNISNEIRYVLWLTLVAIVQESSLIICESWNFELLKADTPILEI